MPYLVAHPAAAIPLHRLLGRHAVPSALILGCIAPDLWNAAPSLISRAASHSFAGLFYFSLPTALAFYVLLHTVLRQPLIDLLPRAAARRLALLRMPPPAWTSIVLSVLAGALSHLIWDSFTHQDGLAVQALAMLRVNLVTANGYELYLYTVLQHASTLIGCALIAYWLVLWWHSTPVRERHRHVLTNGERRGLLAVMGCCAAAAFLPTVAALPAGPELQAVRAAARGSAITALGWLFGALLLYSLSWHCVARAREHKPRG